MWDAQKVANTEFTFRKISLSEKELDGFRWVIWKNFMNNWQRLNRHHLRVTKTLCLSHSGSEEIVKVYKLPDNHLENYFTSVNYT